MGFWALELYKLDPTGQPRKPDPNERFPTSLRNHRLLPSVVYEPILAAMPEFVVWLPGLCRALEGPAQTGGCTGNMYEQRVLSFESLINHLTLLWRPYDPLSNFCVLGSDPNFTAFVLTNNGECASGGRKMARRMLKSWIITNITKENTP